MYSKYIKYLDVYEKGEKVQNAGFVRLELREQEVSIQIKAEKLRHGDAGTYTIGLRAGEKEAVLGEMHLETGCGTVEFGGLQVEKLAGDIAYEELEEIYVQLPGGRVLRCIIREPQMREEVTANSVESGLNGDIAPEVVTGRLNGSVALGAATDNLRGSVVPKVVTSRLSGDVAPKAVEGNMSEAKAVEESPREDVSPKVVVERIREAVATTEEDKQMISLMEEKASKSNDTDKSINTYDASKINKSDNINQENMDEGFRGNMTMPQPISEPGPILRPIPVPPQQTQEERPFATEKWQQLGVIYPHIRPFEDGRDYLKLRPEDLVLLTRRYYPLVTNSFLRHGFYNYGHLILTKEKRPDGEHFYIGVPGNFYEKEKQVAVLYGFESFEGKQEPARNGDFGYYMISVEI